MQVDVTERPELRVATLRHTGPYNRIGEAFARLGEVAGKAGLFGPDSVMLALYYDDPESVPESELRADAAISVSVDARLPGELTERRIPAGRYATMTHLGPYEELGAAWSRLTGDWLPSSGYRLGSGPSFEIYRNTPAETPRHKLRTDLYIPLAEQL